MTVQSLKAISQNNLDLEHTQALKMEKKIFVIHRLFVIIVIFSKYFHLLLNMITLEFVSKCVLK